MNQIAPLPLYHPNKSNTGFACSFSQSAKDGTVFFSLLKQSTWDAEKRIGGFKESRNNPAKSVTVALNQMEVAAILDLLDRNRAYSSMHDSEKQIKSINFSPWMNKVPEGEKATQRGYSFSITITDKQDSTAPKNSFYFGTNYPESRLIREYLIFCLQQAFAGVKIQEVVETI